MMVPDEMAEAEGLPPWVDKLEVDEPGMIVNFICMLTLRPPRTFSISPHRQPRSAPFLQLLNLALQPARTQLGLPKFGSVQSLAPSARTEN